MSFRDFRRSLAALAIPNLTLWLVMGQLTFYVLGLARPDFYLKVFLIPELVLQGEVWRLVTFIFVPPNASNPLWLFIALYFFYFIGTALENAWGAPKYNLYLLVGYVASVGVAFLLALFIPDYGILPVTNAYIGSSVFFAFAMLYPDLPILLFFILPIRVKWLALAAAMMLGWSFCFNGWLARVLILASTANFLIFFRSEIVQNAKLSQRQRRVKAQRRAEADAGPKPFHICAECGLTDQQDRKMDFRYCPGCGGKLAYCTAHLHNHVHRLPAQA